MFKYYFRKFYNQKYDKNQIKRSCKFFSVDFNPIDTNDILDIHKYLMEERLYKIMFGSLG